MIWFTSSSFKDEVFESCGWLAVKTGMKAGMKGYQILDLAYISSDTLSTQEKNHKSEEKV